MPGQLSGGQQQRVAIARAIVIEPPLVLMDEPLSNLDAKLRIETRAEIRRIHKELGRSTIYVTHDQDEALSLADRIVVMKDGVVQQIAAPSDVYGQPANLHVARFMGYRNVLELRGRRRGRRSRESVRSGHAPHRGTQAAASRRPRLRGDAARGVRAGCRTRGRQHDQRDASTTSNTAAAIRWSMSRRHRERCCTCAPRARRCRATACTSTSRSSACWSIQAR